MDPNLLQALQSHDCSEPHEHRQNTRGNPSCTFRKYMKLVLEVLLIAAFCVEILKYFNTESNIGEKLRMLGQLFNTTFSAQSRAGGGVGLSLGDTPHSGWGHLWRRSLHLLCCWSLRLQPLTPRTPHFGSGGCKLKLKNICCDIEPETAPSIILMYFCYGLLYHYRNCFFKLVFVL